MISKAIVDGSLEATRELLEREKEEAQQHELDGYTRNQRRVMKKLQAKIATKQQQVTALARAQKSIS